MKWAALTKPITRPGTFIWKSFSESSVVLLRIIGSCPDGMWPMTIAEKPVATLDGIQPPITDGVHRVARRYKKGVRIETHMHREAQLVYAARGMMQVTTPKGRWLVPPDRAVWVPARLEHSIDVLADIEMRTLYFDLAWLARDQRSSSLNAEFVVRVSRL